jgi:hypothetical protein
LFFCHAALVFHLWFLTTVDGVFCTLSVGEDGSVSFDEVYSTKNASLHCTAYYVGSNNHHSRDVLAYCNSNKVKRSVGVKTELTVVAFVFTPRTVGARVVLTSEQLDLFNKDDSVMLRVAAAAVSNREQISHVIGNKFTSASVVAKEAVERLSIVESHDLCRQVQLLKAVDMEAVDAPDQEPVPSSSAENVLNAPSTCGTSSQDTAQTVFSDASHDAAKHCLSGTSVELSNKKVEAVIVEEESSSKPVDVQCGQVIPSEFTPVNASSNGVHRKEQAVIDPVSIAKSTGLLPRGCSAHLTLAYSKSCQASQTGDDIIDVLCCDVTSGTERPVGTEVDDGSAMLKCYGEGRYMISFNRPITIKALFAGSY